MRNANGNAPVHSAFRTPHSISHGCCLIDANNTAPAASSLPTKTWPFIFTQMPFGEELPPQWHLVPGNDRRRNRASSIPMK
jgi:hypothetical protein